MPFHGILQEASDLPIPTVVPTEWGYHPHTILGNLARCGWRRLILWDQFTFTNASESPDASSLFTCKISFGKWSNNSLHSVKPHSFSSDNATLPRLFNQINYNTPTGNIPLNFSFFATSSVTYDEIPPLWKEVMLQKALEKPTVHSATYVKLEVFLWNCSPTLSLLFL